MTTTLLLPDGWLCAKHDRALLQKAGLKGFEAIKEAIEDLEGMDIEPELAIKRIEEVCEYYKEQQ